MKNLNVVAATLPLVSLILVIGAVIAIRGVGEISTYGPVALLVATLVALLAAHKSGGRPSPAAHAGPASPPLTTRSADIAAGLRRSWRQLGSALPVLAGIALVSTTWMLSGIVPVMIDFGINMLSARFFLVTACVVSGIVSTLLGSSWTTIATVGVAFMGIGSILGVGPAWSAGAIISGAYFGDKVSPLSDTTVVASSACGVDLFSHVRRLMVTTVPAIAITLLVYTLVGLGTEAAPLQDTEAITEGLRSIFCLSPWLMVVPAITVILCVIRVDCLKVLLISAALGVAAMFMAQPALVDRIADGSNILWATARMLLASTELVTGSDLLDSLTATGGLWAMVPTIVLVCAAILFGGVYMGTGMLATLTTAITSRLNSGTSLVAATAGTGVMLNAFTCDQYLSLIIGSNVYTDAYSRANLEPTDLSRTLEDSVTVTSVLIPWNSCGITQSTVLGVATLTYFPFAIFCYLSPLCAIGLQYLREKKHKIAVIR